MKKGTVKTLTLSHKNGNKVLRAGDSVTEKDVINFDKLVKTGFIEIKEAKKEESDLMDLKKDELQAKCTEMGIEFVEADTKAELVAKIEEAEKAE